jgi:hypothetical protein
MQTMKRDSLTAMGIYGGFTGLVAWGLSILTDTGMTGLYAFGFVGMIVVPLYLMWPERTRFRKGSPSADSNHRRRTGTQPS